MCLVFPPSLLFFWGGMNGKHTFKCAWPRPDNMVVVLVAVWCLWLAVTWCLVCRRMTSLITTGNLD